VRNVLKIKDRAFRVWFDRGRGRIATNTDGTAGEETVRGRRCLLDRARGSAVI